MRRRSARGALAGPALGAHARRPPKINRRGPLDARPPCPHTENTMNADATITVSLPSGPVTIPAYTLHATGNEAILLAARAEHDARIEAARAAVAAARAEEIALWSDPSGWSRCRRLEAVREAFKVARRAELLATTARRP